MSEAFSKFLANLSSCQINRPNKWNHKPKNTLLCLLNDAQLFMPYKQIKTIQNIAENKLNPTSTRSNSHSKMHRKRNTDLVLSPVSGTVNHSKEKAFGTPHLFELQSFSPSSKYMYPFSPQTMETRNSVCELNKNFDTNQNIYKYEQIIKVEDNIDLSKAKNENARSKTVHFSKRKTKEICVNIPISSEPDKLVKDKEFKIDKQVEDQMVNIKMLNQVPGRNLASMDSKRPETVSESKNIKVKKRNETMKRIKEIFNEHLNVNRKSVILKIMQPQQTPNLSLSNTNKNIIKNAQENHLTLRHIILDNKKKVYARYNRVLVKENKHIVIANTVKEESKTTVLGKSKLVSIAINTDVKMKKALRFK